jgi:hypothetical protein
LLNNNIAWWGKLERLRHSPAKKPDYAEICDKLKGMIDELQKGMESL